MNNRVAKRTLTSVELVGSPHLLLPGETWAKFNPDTAIEDGTRLRLEHTFSQNISDQVVQNLFQESLEDFDTGRIYYAKLTNERLIEELIARGVEDQTAEELKNSLQRTVEFHLEQAGAPNVNVTTEMFGVFTTAPDDKAGEQCTINSLLHQTGLAVPPEIGNLQCIVLLPAGIAGLVVAGQLGEVL